MCFNIWDVRHRLRCWSDYWLAVVLLIRLKCVNYSTIIFLFVLWNLGSEKMRIWWKALFSLSDAPKTKAVCYKMYVKRQFWWNTPKKQGLHPTSENERTKLVHGLSVLPPHALFIMVCSWTKMFGLVALTTQGCIAHSASIKRVFFPSCLNVAHGLLFFRYCSKVWKFKINSNLPTSAGEILQSW